MFLKVLIIGIVFFLLNIPSQVYAKSIACNLSNTGLHYVKEASSYTKNIIDHILALGDFQSNYTICATSGMSNVVAFINGSGHKIIVYDSVFLEQKAKEANELHWGRVAILAHEIGHHVLQHTTTRAKSLAEKRSRELAADKFAGLVLGHLGASLTNSKALMRTLGIRGDDTGHTHPSTRKRVSAVTKGWLKACKDIGRECNNQFMKKKKRITYYAKPVKNSTSGFTNFINWAEKLKGVRVNRNYCKQYANIAVQQAKRSIQYRCGFDVYAEDPAKQWSLDWQPQFNWCMKMSSYATQRETIFREKKIFKCKF